MQNIKSEFEGLGKRNYASTTDLADHSQEEDEDEDLDDKPVVKQELTQKQPEQSEVGVQKRRNGLISGKAKHPKSLWRDQSLVPRDLDRNGETIFDIIMPWVKEQKEE